MARARQTAKRKPTKRRSSGFGLFVLGMIVGTVGTALFMGVLQDRPSDIGSGIDSLLNSAKNGDEKIAVQTAPRDDSKPAVPGVSFDFYELLLEDEIVLPEPRQSAASTVATASAEKSAEPVATETAPQPKEQPADPGSVYVLQIASYRSFADADRVKASLALNGLVAYIQKITIEGRGEFFRVRLGPFEDLQTMQDARNRLTQIGYKPVRFKIRRQG